MCGIVGISARAFFDASALRAAAARLAHRGPDGDGVFVDSSGKVALGHTRLAIIDLSPTGAQPMQSADGRFTITFNGEIYNYRELRTELAALGRRFRGPSDTEVLLEGYAALGEAVLQKLNGIFAFAIHDAETGEVLIARDHLGVKPLYYVEAPEGLAFASETKALYDLVDLDRSIDPHAIRKYLTFLWCPGEQTALKAVKKLGPGSAMVVREGQVIRRWAYWRPPAYWPRRDWTSGECAREIAAAIDAAVERQLIADVPVGAFLSGGLDSSAIVAAARKAGRAVDCFTIDTSEAEEGSTDDLPYARQVARHLGLKLHEVKVDARTMCDGLMKMVRMLDEPLADPACLNVLYISELARTHGMKVLLSGTGGDDLFSGYRRHTVVRFDRLWAVMPAALRRTLARTAERGQTGSALARRIAKAMSAAGEDGSRRISGIFAWGPLGIGDRLLAAELREAGDFDDVFQPLDDLLAKHPRLPPLEKCLALEQRFFLADHNLTYTDKMAMAASVEVRVPLLDLELVELAAQVPSTWKHTLTTPKWILKQSQRGRLPSRIIDRPKTGFGVPLRSWMKGEMRDWTEELLSPATLKRRGLFDPVEVNRLRQADMEGRTDGSYTLLSLMCVELWCRSFVDAAPSEMADTPVPRVVR